MPVKAHSAEILGYGTGVVKLFRAVERQSEVSNLILRGQLFLWCLAVVRHIHTSGCNLWTRLLDLTKIRFAPVPFQMHLEGQAFLLLRADQRRIRVVTSGPGA